MRQSGRRARKTVSKEQGLRNLKKLMRKKAIWDTNPVEAKRNKLRKAAREFLDVANECARGETGRHKGLKIPREQSHDGSTPSERTNVHIEWKVVNPGEVIDRLKSKLKAEGILDEILAEYNKARAKHKPMRGHHEGWAVIKEEFDELWDEIKVDNYPRARKEAIQMAAMTLAYLVEVCDANYVPNAADSALAA